jgi:hypothetical protein
VPYRTRREEIFKIGFYANKKLVEMMMMVMRFSSQVEANERRRILKLLQSFTLSMIPSPSIENRQKLLIRIL